MENSLIAVIDTNVIVSALISKRDDTPPYLIVRSIFDGIITPIFNPDILNEYREVLLRPKFNLDPSDVEAFLIAFVQIGLYVEEVTDIPLSLPDPKDLVFYRVQKSIENAYLVTGNLKHFPQESRIVSPADILLIMASSE